MKKRIITIALSFMIVAFYAQDTTISTSTQLPVKKHLNELGLDVTPFIKFYLNFSANNYYYQPNYMLTYRRYFKKSNLRAAIGGNYTFSESPSPYNGDSLDINYTNKQSSFVFRLGYEFFQDLSKRWQVFYGADVNVSNAHQRNDAQYWNGGYSNGVETNSTGFGLAPMLGLRFKINKRISLITETSFLMQYSENSSYRYYRPVTSNYPSIPNDPKTTTKSFNTTFNYPLSLIFTVNL